MDLYIYININRFVDIYILEATINHLIENCYFNNGKQAIGIPVGINPAPFWVNHFLYSYEKEHMSSLEIHF